MKIRRTIAAVTAFTALIVTCSGSFPAVLRLPVTEASYDTASDNVWDYEECEDGIKLTEYNGMYYELPVEIPAIYDGKEVREVSADIFARHLIQALRINDTSVRFDGNILEGTDISRIETPDLTFGRRTVKIYADDYPGKKAEKLYEICATNDELVKVLLQLETLVEREQQDERSVQQLQNPQVVLSGGAGRGLDL